MFICQDDEVELSEETAVETPLYAAEKDAMESSIITIRVRSHHWLFLLLLLPSPVFALLA